jgi:hypothetical protein
MFTTHPESPDPEDKDLYPACRKNNPTGDFCYCNSRQLVKITVLDENQQEEKNLNIKRCKVSN